MNKHGKKTRKTDGYKGNESQHATSLVNDPNISLPGKVDVHRPAKL